MNEQEFNDWVYANLTPDEYHHELHIHWRDMKHAIKMWDVMKIGDRKFENDEMRVEVPAYGQITFKVLPRRKIGECC